MLQQIVVFTILCTALGHISGDFGLQIDHQWDTFKKVYQKQYTNEEDTVRRQVFKTNVQRIVDHNLGADLGLHSFRLGVNKFTDLTSSEFQALKGLNKREKSISHGHIPESRPYVHDLPSPSLDWRTKGIVPPVRDGGQCSVCNPSSAIDSLQGGHALVTGKTVALSLQQLVDCLPNACTGGTVTDAFDYIKKNKGVDTEASYPFTGTRGTCRFKKANVGATLKGYTVVTKGDEEALKRAVATYGPISVAVDASHMSFQLYVGGVYDEEECDSELLDHVMSIVGYGSENGKDFWIVKNCWGSTWGESGYIRMARNKSNQCGIATDALYPLF
jgi:cathepsin L